MQRDDAAGRRLSNRVHGAAALALALVIFALDVLTPLQGAVAVLYTVAVVMVARAHDRALVIATGAGAFAMAITGYVISHSGEPLGSPAIRLGVSLTAIIITTLLCVRNEAAAEARRASEQRYRTIFNAGALPIWEGDWSAAHALLRDGAAIGPELIERIARITTIRAANDAAARLFGLPDARALVGHTIAGHHTPAAAEALGRIVGALMRGDPMIEEETQFLTASRDVVDVVVSVTLPPGSDAWSRVLVMAVDVTERNRSQARLAQAQAELAHMARVTTLGQLAASIAHEVNQPLSAIITYARSGQRWLAREAPDAVEAKDCLDHIAANGARAADVIARIRDLARKADPRDDQLDLALLAEDTVALLERDLHTNAIAIEVDMDADMPPLRGDRVQIQQVLMNLMLNAEQAMADAPAARRAIRIVGRPDGDGVAVDVRDWGCGIAGDPNAVFAPFFTTKAEGLGMGLSICRSIVERHGGTLSATNNPEGGATFRIRLPAASGEDA